jgi:hypothetical protein
VTVSTGSEIAVHVEEYVPPVAAPPADLVALLREWLSKDFYGQASKDLRLRTQKTVAAFSEVPK